MARATVVDLKVRRDMDKAAGGGAPQTVGTGMPKKEDLEELAVRFVLNTIDANME